MTTVPTTPRPIVVGYTVKVRDPATARNFLNVQPPGNLKKPESIEAWRKDPEKQKQAWAQLDAYAPWMKLTGAVDRVVALHVSGREIFDSARLEDSERSAGGEFVDWLLRMYNFELPDDKRPCYPVAIYGFNPKPLMRLAGQNAIRDGMQVPLNLWYAGHDNHVRDPKEMILEADVKKVYPLAKVCAEAPLGPIAIPDGYRPHSDPMLDLRLATELCISYQLLPSEHSATLRELVEKQPELGLQEEEAEPEEAEKKPAAKSKKKEKAAAK